MHVQDEVDDSLRCDRSLSVVLEESASSNSWSTPSARELAEQRQRELHADNDLKALRHEMSLIESDEASKTAIKAAAAAASTAAKISKPYDEALALLTALCPNPKTAIEKQYVKAFENREPRNVLQHIIDETVDVVQNASDPCMWTSEDRMTIARVLCAVVLWGGGLRARRTLHWLLEGCRLNELRELARGGGGLRLADGVRSGSKGDTLAALIVANELSALARMPTAYPITAENVAALLARCQLLPQNHKLLAYALAGRALALIGRNAKVPPQTFNFHSCGRTVGDHRLAIVSSKLQILFGYKYNALPKKF